MREQEVDIMRICKIDNFTWKWYEKCLVVANKGCISVCGKCACAEATVLVNKLLDWKFLLISEL